VGAAVLAAAVHRMAKDVLSAAGTPVPSVASQGSAGPDDKAGSAGRRRAAVARVAAAVGVVVVVIGRRRRSRRRAG